MARKRSSVPSKTRKPARASDTRKTKKKGPPVPEVRIGEKVRQLRKKNGYSIQKLAELSGVSPAGIYKIETNGMVPTITTLVKLAVALEQRVSYFVEEEDALPEVRCIRKSERAVLVSGQEGRSEVISERIRRGGLEGLFRTLEPGSRSRNPLVQSGREQLIYCLKGDLSVVRGEETFHLKEGDTLHYNANGRVQLENAGRYMAQFLILHAPFPGN